MNRHHDQQELVALDPGPKEVGGAPGNGASLAPIIRALVTCHTSLKAPLRRLIVDHLTQAPNPDRCVDELLLLCTTKGGPDGLDMAIDILAQTGKLALEYARQYAKRDSAFLNDDHGYVLLRAVARASLDATERFDLIAAFARASSRGIREGVVEGLCDLATPKAREMLKTLMQDDADPYIREIAGEAAADLES